MKQERLLAMMQKVAVTAAIVAFLACILTSCKTVREVQTEYIDRYVHDSVLVEKIDTIIKVQEHRDSVVLRDSVFINVWQSADTIYKVREVYKYRDRISVKHDTIHDVKIDVQYKERIDTAYINKDVVKTEYVKEPLSWLQKSLIGLGIIALIVFVVSIIRLVNKGRN